MPKNHAYGKNIKKLTLSNNFKFVRSSRIFVEVKIKQNV